MKKKLPNRKGFRNKSELERIGAIVASVAGYSNSDIVEMYNQHEQLRNKRVAKNTDPVRSETLNRSAKRTWPNWLKAGPRFGTVPKVFLCHVEFRLQFWTVLRPVLSPF